MRNEEKSSINKKKLSKIGLTLLELRDNNVQKKETKGRSVMDIVYMF
jgi:hypothetical protein